MRESVGRRRLAKNRGLEKYVRVNRAGYVSYKHPLMNEYESFGRGPEAIKSANETAKIVNAELSPEGDRASRILARRPRANPDNLPLFSQVIDEFQAERMPELEWSKGYQQLQIARMEKLKEYGGHAIYENTDVRFFREMVNTEFSGDGRRVAITLLRLIDEWACGVGHRIGPNVASRVLKPRQARRQRCRIDNYKDYLAIRSRAEFQWERDLMDFALITLQPRQVLCSLDLTKHFHKEGERQYIRFQRGKTGVHIEIEIGPSLNEIIERRKKEAMRLGSRRLFCRPPGNGNNVNIEPTWLTKHITRLMIRSGLYENNHPTLHELRSLGGRLMEEKGFDRQLIQDLMGHKEPSTTEIYLNPDKPKYTKAKAVLELE